jgi:hypothetical protein
MSVHAPRPLPTTHLGSDTPRDYVPASGSAHRFPAATYLSRQAAREERAFALHEIAATGRAASRRIGSVGLLALGLFAAMLYVVTSGRTAEQVGVTALWALGVASGLAVVGLVVLIVRHDRLHEQLAERVRRYETRLLELRAQRVAH